MIGIIGAMEIEVESIKALLTDKKETVISGISFVSGRCEGKDIVVAKCGVGKVFAGICTEIMILEFSPEFIINTGVAGCLDENLRIGDIVIADSVCQHDMDTSPAGDPKGLISGINVIKIYSDEKVLKKLEKSVQRCGLAYSVGTVATGDRFVTEKEHKEFIKSEFGAKACEMEGGAIGHVCYINDVPFAVMRAMSDTADGSAEMEYAQFLDMAARNSINVIKEFLKIRG